MAGAFSRSSPGISAISCGSAASGAAISPMPFFTQGFRSAGVMPRCNPSCGGALRTLVVEFWDNILHALAAHADARADRIDFVVRAVDGDLCAIAGFAG